MTYDAPLFRVALAVPHGVPFLERLQVGVAQHARAAGWTFVRMPGNLDEFSLDWLHEWRGDGALVAALSPKNLTLVRRLTIPVVNLVSNSDDDGIPAVSIDHQAVGRLAARTLRSRGFVHLAYYGQQNTFSSQLRKLGFIAALAEDGLHPQIFEANTYSPRTLLTHQRRLEHWLSSLPAQTGVFTWNDMMGVEVLQTCQRLGLAVPEHLAVLGVDDDPVLCEFSQPQLSSIIRNNEKTGLVAASLLQRLMEARRHNRPTPTDRLHPTIPPLGVTERRSTSTYACRHPQVEELVRRIKSGLDRTLCIDELTQGLSLSRRRLECLFREELGVSIYQFALRARLGRARELIARNDGHRTLTAIAKDCGFKSLSHLRQAFRREAGPAQESSEMISESTPPQAG